MDTAALASLQNSPASTSPPQGATAPSSPLVFNPGDRYAGTTLNPAGQPTHHLVLLAARPNAPMDWATAKAWATSVGGELPTRQESALLFANCRDALPEALGWSSEEYEIEATCAWVCNFYNGYQNNHLRKSYEGSAVAIRRIPLESAAPLHSASSTPHEAAGTFTHTPRPALIPASHPQLRRFGADKETLDYKLKCSSKTARPMQAEARVLRDGERDAAELTLKLGLYTNAEITVELTPDELRDLARRLIDAAHDLEAHPAAALAREAQEQQQALAEVQA